MYCLCVNVYCHRVSTQLQLTNISIYQYTYILLYLILHSIPDQSVRFVVDRVALGQVFLHVPHFSPVSIILPMLHTQFDLYIGVTRRANGRSLPPAKRSALSEIGQRRIEKFFQYSSQLIMDTTPGPPSPPPPVEAVPLINLITFTRIYSRAPRGARPPTLSLVT
jgi:hypothetical protein